MKEIFAFLRELRLHNNREWFTEHKEEYIRLKEKFEGIVEELTGQIALFDEEVKGLKPKDCIYRIYRDTRFSPDKTPYKTHFAAYICAPLGRSSERVGYYFHIEPDGSLLGGGLYCPQPALLKRLRQDIYDNIDELVAILRDPEFAAEFPEIDRDGMLKRVPAPFPADFPEADLLKYKHYDVVSYKPDLFFESGDGVKKAADVFRKLYPFNRFLNYTVDQ